MLDKNLKIDKLKLEARKQQRRNAAKFLYDIAKIVFAALVAGNIVAGERFNSAILIFGLFWSSTFALFAFFLDGYAEKEERFIKQPNQKRND